MYQMELIIEHGAFKIDIDGDFIKDALGITPAEMLTIGNDEGSDIRLLNQRPGAVIASIKVADRGLVLRKRLKDVPLFINNQEVTDYAPMQFEDRLRIGNVVLRLSINYALDDLPYDSKRLVQCDGELTETGGKCAETGTMPLVPPFEQAGWLCNDCIDRIRAPKETLSKFPSSSVSNFELLRIAGHGGFGDVYEAVDKVTSAHAAVKIVKWTGKDDKSIGRFVLREQMVHRSFTHPCIVRYYASGATDDYYFIAMEFVCGGSIRRELASFERMEEVIRVAADLFEALAYIHSLKYVHRDIKPENAILTRPDDKGLRRAKLGDFGLLKSEAGSLVLTGTTEVAGSMSCMAPEVPTKGGFRNFAESSDLYSAAATVYWILAGHAPIIMPTTGQMSDIVKVVRGANRLSLNATCMKKFRVHRHANDIFKLIDQLLNLDPNFRKTTDAASLAWSLRSYL